MAGKYYMITNQRKEFKPIPTEENIMETTNQRKEFKPNTNGRKI
jgi:hypothetical protein